MLLRETALDTASVMLMICAASAFGFYLAWEMLPPKLAAWLVTLTKDPTSLLLLLNLMLIVLGTAVEGVSALIILTPVLLPVINKLGIDPVHFGIIMVTNLTIAGVTPPVGQMMFISSQVLKVPMNKYAVEVMPFNRRDDAGPGAADGVPADFSGIAELDVWQLAVGSEAHSPQLIDKEKKTMALDMDALRARVARFKDLQSSSEAFVDTRIPEYNREIYNVIGAGSPRTRGSRRPSTTSRTST